MTSDEMQELKRLAESVPKEDGVHVSARGEDVQHVKTVGAFIRAATPDVVLSLIARIEELEGK